MNIHFAPVSSVLSAILATVIMPNVGITSEPSAFVRSLSGTCLLNRGKSIKTASPGQLFPGDTVTCTEGSEATIVYNNECEVRMPAESRLVIGVGDEACEVLATAMIIPGATAAAVVNVPALIAGYSIVPIVAVVDTTIQNNSENDISGE